MDAIWQAFAALQHELRYAASCLLFRLGRAGPILLAVQRIQRALHEHPVKGVVIAQHDLLDEAGRLVFSCLTRSVFRR